MNDKIKLEDLTLKQIRFLKEIYRSRVEEALTAIKNEFMEKHDCGFPEVRVHQYLDGDAIRDNMGEPLIYIEEPVYEIDIKFSKEDE